MDSNGRGQPVNPQIGIDMAERMAACQRIVRSEEARAMQEVALCGYSTRLMTTAEKRMRCMEALSMGNHSPGTVVWLETESEERQRLRPVEQV